MSEKRVGCCSLCNQEVFEAVSRWPSGFVLEQQIADVGAPVKGARRVTFLLVNGSLCDMTFCDRCDPVASNLAKLWKKVCTTMAKELDPKYRAEIGAKQQTDEQRTQSEDNLINLFNNPPVGVLYEQPWSEVVKCPN
ncbi:MAG: hypothetical protein V3R58_08500 [candidate division NC10 bacterium]